MAPRVRIRPGKKPAPSLPPVILPEPPPAIVVPRAAALKITLPAGNVKIAPPGKTTPYNIPWSRAKPFLASYEQHAATYNLDPYVLLLMGLVESQWRQFDAGGDVLKSAECSGCCAIGIGQVKPCYHGAKAQELNADLETADGNIEVQAALMGGWVARFGSWQKAISQGYHNGTDPHSGANGLSYVATIEAGLIEAKGIVDPADPWRPYPYPPMRKDAHVIKPGERAGFDRVAPRRARIVGSSNHITDGVPSGDQVAWYRNFFGWDPVREVWGERAWDALTDTVIADNGDIGLLNDWRDPDWGGRRAGWANGTATGIEGDGVAFFRHYPLINDVLVSKEHVTRTGRPITADCLDASIELSTAVAQEAKCPWDKYPYHPGFHGVNIEQMHKNFAPKACPAEPFISTSYPKLVAGVRAKLKAHQGGDPSGPTPEPVDTFTKWGMTAEHLAWFFGEMTRVNEDGSTEQLPFSTTGPLSLLWMSRCEAEGVFPEADYLQSWDSKIAPGKEWYATWQNGWVAWLPLDDSRASWRWIDKTDIT